MIVHDILKKKPLVALKHIRDVIRPRQAEPTVHYPVVPLQDKIVHQVKSQIEFNTMMDDFDFDEHEYVTHKHIKSANELYQVFFVGSIVVAFENIPFWSTGGFPLSVRTLGCWPGAVKFAGVDTNFEWDNGAKYRKLTSAEYVLLIDDHVRNYVKTRLALAKP